MVWVGMFWTDVGAAAGSFNSSIAVGAVIMTGADNIMNRTDRTTELAIGISLTVLMNFVFTI